MPNRTLALSARIEFDDHSVLDAVVRSLDEEGCRLDCVAELGAARVPSGIWLGAIGPLRVKAQAGFDDRLTFDGAIHPSIVRHFNA